MKRQHKILTLTVALALVATETFAQSMWGGDPYGRYDRGFSVSMAMIRVFTMIASIGAGFGLGWLLSPFGRNARHSIMLVIGGLTMLIAIFNGGALGWSTTWLVSIIGFLLAFGYWVGATIKSLGEVPTTFGSSRWADHEDLEDWELFGTEGIRLGEAFNGTHDQVISYKGDSHSITVAPTRSGKGTTQIIPNLLTYDGSVLVIDPKGENAMITAQARKNMGQDVCILDPWGIAQVEGIETARFNPMSGNSHDATPDLARPRMAGSEKDKEH